MVRVGTRGLPMPHDPLRGAMEDLRARLIAGDYTDLPALAERIEPCDHPCTGIGPGKSGGIRPLHAQHDVRAPGRIRRHFRPGGGIVRIGNRRGFTRPGFHRDDGPQGHEFLDSFGRRRNAGFPDCAFLQDRDPHRARSSYLEIM